MSNSLIGNLLVASTLVDDPVLSKAVCLVVHEDENGFIGVMLNRPIHPNPGALMQMVYPNDQADTNNSIETNRRESAGRLSHEDFNVPDIDDDGANLESGTQLTPHEDQHIQNTIANANAAIGTVHFGGPLNGPVVAIHGSSEFAEAETGHGIYVAAQKPNLEALVQSQDSSYRLIVGHIGWTAEQLQAEFDAGYWHIVPATTDAVFAHDMEMWPRVICRATANSLAQWVGIPDAPFAHQLN